MAICLVAGCLQERSRPGGEPASGAIHARGISDPSSDAFHGRALARSGWDLASCARCHGDDFAGGASGVACTSCHRDGPAACATCHRDDELSGAHHAHAGADVACAECHEVPLRWDAEGHVRRGGAADPPPAEIAFGARAALTLDPADRAGPPEYAEGRCANVYCHGDALHAGGGRAPRPRWSDPSPVGGCTQCHGAPPPSHASDRCESCHRAAPHVDGAVQIGRAPGCSGCHGSAASPAPPFDLDGNPFTTAIGVGAHQAHLGTPSRLRGPIACGDCHRVPAQLGDAGHLDSPPPAEVGASLGWSRTTAQCASAWCHGSARPVWTATGGASCGTCHGVPPASHAPDLPLTSCATCHPRTIDPAGTILIELGPFGPASEHIDGDVDLQ